MDVRHRNHTNYWGFLIHRVSGVLLALFLPIHFFALSTAIRGDAALDGFLTWADQPLVKVGEFGLVILLAVHLAGGLRVMALEFLGWRTSQKNMVAVSIGFAIAAGLGFLLNAF